MLGLVVKAFTWAMDLALLRSRELSIKVNTTQLLKIALTRPFLISMQAFPT